MTTASIDRELRGPGRGEEVLALVAAAGAEAVAVVGLGEQREDGSGAPAACIAAGSRRGETSSAPAAAGPANPAAEQTRRAQATAVVAAA